MEEDQQLPLPANWLDRPINEKQTEPPTAEEEAYLQNYADLPDGIELIRPNSECVKLPPKRFLLKNLDRLPQDCSLDRHGQIVMDIFMRKMLKNAGGNLKTTRYWLNILHPAYVEEDGFWIMHKTYQMADGLTLINTIASHNQSKFELALDDTLQVRMRIFTTDKSQGKGKGGRIPDQVMKKFGLRNQNVLGKTHCLPKALAIGKVWSDLNSCNNTPMKNILVSKYRSLVRSDVSSGYRPKLQLTEAKNLLIEAGMDPNQEEHNLEDLEKLAIHLKDYKIRVWTAHKGVPAPTTLYNFNEEAERCIPIFLVNEHYEFFVPSVKKVEVRFCFNCHTFANKHHWRKCDAVCKRCGRLECEPGPWDRVCNKCSITFHSDECYNAHLEKMSKKAFPFCDKYEKCQKCFKIHPRDSYSKIPHVCHQYDYCKICNQKISGPHQCNHAAPTKAARKRQLKRQEDWTMVIYDYESIVSNSGEYRGAKSFGVKHEPNMLCYRIICNKCMGKHCTRCGDVQYISYKQRPGETGSVMERFANFLRTDPRLKNAYIVAHNGGRYDHVFTLQQLAKDGEYYDPNFLMSGNTFISADLAGKDDNPLHFRDSVKYIPMRLDQLPGAFELPTKAKGFFPYLYNHPDNYEDPLPHLPAIEYYEPKYMSVTSKPEFEKWYDENKDTPFDLHEQLLEYCKNDVQILVEALAKYMKICLDTFAGWNPIIQSPTLASYVLHVMQHEHIQHKTIGYIPEDGWPGRNNSEFALKYLLWLEHKDPELKIQHKLRTKGEYVADCGDKSFFVDGYDPKTNCVFEIHGCLWHGCKKCYLDRKAKCPRNKSNTMAILFDLTIRKDTRLIRAGFKTQTKWECEIKEELRKDREMAEFFKNCRYAYHLRPREAMHGGRTQQFKSLVKACSEYSIEYYDFCSLYPYINIKGAEYPIGIPDQITEDFKPIEDGPLPYKGLVFCTILPPQALILPVLPYRVEGKLLFPLCRSCAESKGSKKCTHTKVSERCLTGVWCTDELNLAIEEGYQIQKYHEVWHWDSNDWFRGGFFESFMSPLLKMKHEASGWPRSDMTEEEKDNHIKTIFENDGVQLELENIKKNPALRSLAKLFLNSTWGKFAQNPSKTETKLFHISKCVEATKFISETGFEPKCYEEWGDDRILCARKPVKDSSTTSKYNNIVYGAITTSAARIKLYRAMKQVGPENLIYCDTDSIIFRQKRGDDVLGSLRGDALGMMTNETPDGFEITEIVAMAPKVYALKMVDGQGNEKCVTKAKGVTLNSETSSQVNFDSMKRMMQNHLKGEPSNFIVGRMRMKRGANILDGLETVIEAKKLRPVMDKGVFDEDGALLPYGMLENNENMEDDYEFKM